MSVSQAMIRGYNFFVIAFLGILGGSLITEVFTEDEWLFRVDELLLIAIGVVAIIWYLIGQHRLTRSPFPLILAIAALAAKIVGLILEIKDAADVGDDIGLVQLLLLFTIVAIVAYVRTRQLVRYTSTQETIGVLVQDVRHETGSIK